MGEAFQFQESLKRLVVETEGGVAGLLMGFDGIAVDSYSVAAAGMDITTVGMEFSFILQQVRKAAEILEVGTVNEITIRASKVTIIIRAINAEYFLALAIRPEGNLGKGRYLLRIVAPKLQVELV
jgi:predicted regulator of Ras-like GTPase activity (Roadblock/LC7/MglB family)